VADHRTGPSLPYGRLCTHHRDLADWWTWRSNGRSWVLQVRRRDSESFVDDLGTWRGVVLGRAVTTLRSVETQPYAWARFRRENATFDSRANARTGGRVISVSRSLVRNWFTGIFAQEKQARSGTWDCTLISWSNQRSKTQVLNRISLKAPLLGGDHSRS